MKKRLFVVLALLVVIVISVVALVAQNGTAQDKSWGDPSTDPQTLMIPRWFLTGLTNKGQQVELGDVQITLQFTGDGQINGSAGCNDYFASFEAGTRGEMSFGPVGATKMFCDDRMQQEMAYLEALAQINQFKTEQGKLLLSSADGQTTLIFSMPPK
jgi:heat shock protein HslJ